MACEKCLKYKGDSTTHYSELTDIFELNVRGFSSLIEAGIGKCRFCGQEITYDFDSTLIPKLRVTFVES